MERIALQLYLRDLRDLELIRRKINVRYQNARHEYEQKLTDWISRDQDPAAMKGGSAPVWPYIVFSVVCALLGAVLVFLGGYDITGGIMRIGRSKEAYEAISAGVTWWNLLLVITGFAGMLGGVALAFAGRYRLFRNGIRKKRREEDHVHERRAIEDKWESSRVELKDKKDQVDQLLEKAYGYGILPPRYRELAAVWYLWLRMNNTNKKLDALVQQEEREYVLRRYRDRVRREILKGEDAWLEKRRQEIADEKTVMANIRMLSEMAAAAPAYAALFQAVQETYMDTCNLFSHISV